MWDTTETLEFERPKLRVRVTKYPKYACQSQPQCGIASPERPTALVEGNKYDTSIAAEIITGKYGYHLPLYRQQDYFAGSGWTPSRSTLCNILSQSYSLSSSRCWTSSNHRTNRFGGRLRRHGRDVAVSENDTAVRSGRCQAASHSRSFHDGPWRTTSPASTPRCGPIGGRPSS